MLSSFVKLAVIASALAAPLEKRQTIVVLSETPIATATLLAPTPITTIVDGRTEVRSASMSDMMSAGSMSMMSGSMASMPSMASASMASASGAASNAYPAYPCPSGYLLTYQESEMNYPYSMAAMANLGLENWSSGPQYGRNVSGTGNNIGDTRTINTLITNQPSFQEVLVNTTTADMFYQTVSNLTAPIVIGEVRYSNWSQVFQLYTNNTGIAMSGSPVAGVKLFTNACSSNQTAAVLQLDDYFTTVFTNIRDLIAGNSTASGSGSMSMSMPSATAMPSALSRLVPSGVSIPSTLSLGPSLSASLI